jgi:hypothetical protein
MSERSPRPRKAAGPERPKYLGPDDVDRVAAVLLALTSEVATLRERIDTHERLAAKGLPASPEHVETHVPEPDVEAAREAWRDAYIRRLFRVFTEDVEGLARSAGPEG